METLWLCVMAVFALLLLFLAALGILLVYSGLFEGIEVGAGRPPISQVVIAYKFARGPYKNVGPLFDQVCKIAPDHKCLGIYYDDPRKVEAKRLRHIVGSILAEGSQTVDEELVRKFEAEGFKTYQLPQVDNVVRTSFPFITTLSIFIAVYKVYPRMHRYMTEHSLCAHPYLEVYDGKIMHFMAPLSRQGDFYVPEALQHFEGEEPYESFYSDESTFDLTQCDISTSTEVCQAEPSALDSSQLQPSPKWPTSEAESPVPQPGQDEKGSDEDSTSSFEEVKFDVKTKGQK